jgi:hypothetical protein
MKELLILIGVASANDSKSFLLRQGEVSRGPRVSIVSSYSPANIVGEDAQITRSEEAHGAMFEAVSNLTRFQDEDSEDADNSKAGLIDSMRMSEDDPAAAEFAFLGAFADNDDLEMLD